MIRQPDLARAEKMAYTLAVQYGRMPVCPMALLRSCGEVSVHTYAELAELLGQEEDFLEQEYAAVEAFTMRMNGRWVVAYRSGGHPARRRFTLAHELGHIALMHDTEDSTAEREADHFASCLLCPAPALTGEVAEIARRCFVSVTAARMAMRRRRFLKDEALLEQVNKIVQSNNEEAICP